jgi:hypothetical protein
VDAPDTAAWTARLLDEPGRPVPGQLAFDDDPHADAHRAGHPSDPEEVNTRCP